MSRPLLLSSVCRALFVPGILLAATMGAVAADTVTADTVAADTAEPCIDQDCSAPGSTETSQQLVLADVGLRLQVPNVWKLHEPKDGPFAALGELPPKRALAMLTRSVIDPSDSKTQGLDDLLAELPRSFAQYEVISKDRRQVTPDLYGDVVEVRGTARGRTLRHTTYLFEGYGERFSLTFATEDLKHAELASQFASIAASLELRGPNPHSARFLELIKNAPRDLSQLRQALDSGADINAEDSDGFTALAAAIFSGNGLLVKWLLEQGADPGKPEKLASMLPLVASPPIYELLLEADPSIPPTAPGKPEALEIEWVSAEAQLFVGIKQGRLADVEGALKAGADLEALEPTYRLDALALTRRLIEEFEQLDLDPSRFRPIEQLLTRAVSQVPSGT